MITMSERHQAHQELLDKVIEDMKDSPYGAISMAAYHGMTELTKADTDYITSKIFLCPICCCWRPLSKMATEIPVCDRCIQTKIKEE